MTLVEVLIVVAILGLLAALALAAMPAWLQRVEVGRKLDDFEQLLVRARLAAIRLQTDVVVSMDPADGSVEAFTDRNRDRLQNAPGDFVARLDLGNAGFGGPSLARAGADSTTGLTPRPGGGWPILVYQSTGSPLDAGAFRLLDGPNRNCFEVAVHRLTGLTEVRKYLVAADAVAGVAGFFAEHSNPGDPLWNWY